MIQSEVEVPFPTVDNVYWIGGSYSGGKSTAAKRLCAKFGLSLYQQDAHILGDEVFVATRVSDGEWFWLPIEQKFDRYRLAFPLSVTQILEQANSGPVIVEGPGLLPHLLAGASVHPSRVIYLLPTPEFQRWANRNRATISQHGDWVAKVLSSRSDPDAAWERWMALDDEFANEIERAATGFGYRTIRVSRSHGQADVASMVARHFGLTRDA